MKNVESLREPMSMPDPHFPIKVSRTAFDQKGFVMFPHHWHEHLEFLYVVSGTATFECGSNAIAATEGDLVVVNSNELHYGICQSSDLVYYVMIADIALLHSQSIDAADTKFITPITQNRLLFQNHITDNRETTASMLGIIQELENQEFGYELAIKSELYRLMTLLIRGHVSTVLTTEEYTERMKNVERFAPVFQYIDTHYMKELSVEQLADMANLSRYHFSRLFKELCGHTVTEYVTMTRLNKADYLLRHTPLTVTEIASATGFNDIYYFSRTFKKHKKVAPSMLRK